MTESKKIFSTRYAVESAIDASKAGLTWAQFAASSNIATWDEMRPALSAPGVQAILEKQK